MLSNRNEPAILLQWGLTHQSEEARAESPPVAERTCFNGASLIRVRKGENFRTRQVDLARFNGASLIRVRKGRSARLNALATIGASMGPHSSE